MANRKDLNQHVGVRIEVLKDQNGLIIALLKTLMDVTDVIDTQNEEKLESIVFVVLLMIILIVISFFIFNKLFSPIKELIDSFKNLFKDFSESKGDLTKKLQINSKDEIGILAGHFNDFLLALNKIITHFKKSSEKAKHISNDLTSISEESAAALERMITVVGDMKDEITRLDKEDKLALQAARQLEEFISNVVNLIGSQSTAISESSTSMRQMSASIQNVAEVSQAKLEIVNQLEKTASSGQTEMKKSMEIIKKVADSAYVIMEMIDVINNIAEQTNLLAMNAAIEAAHAGQYGKGFAVVADEIRKLAENTAKNSKEISNSLKEVMEYISISEGSTAKAGESFEKTIHYIKEVANSMVEMRNDTQDLAKGSTKIMLTLVSLLEITEKVNSSSAEMNQKVEKITHSMENINLISSVTKNSIEEITDGLNQLYKTAEIVSEAGIKNNESVSELEGLVSQFKTEQTTYNLATSD